MLTQITCPNLTVTLSGGQSFNYQLAGQEADTTAHIQSDSVGGVEVVLIAEPQTVGAGQKLVISNGQTGNGIIILSGGTVDVLSGGTITNTLDNGLINVASCGIAIGTVLGSGGVLYANQGAATSGGNLDGGSEYDFGQADGTTINGGVQFVEFIANGTTVNGGAQFVYGTVDATTVHNGNQFVYGVADGTTLSSGGVEFVYGLDQGATVGDAGVQQVHGVATGATLYSGGTQNVLFGGAANGTFAV